MVTDINPWAQFKEQVIKALRLSSGQDLSKFLEVPADLRHGDLACTAAFHLAQELKKNPVEIAQELTRYDPTRFPLIEQVVAQGPYVNFYVNIIPYRRLIVDAITAAGDAYGTSTKFAGKHAVVEFPAVNPNKPLHIGHVRNAVLGDTISRLLRAAGYNVTRMDYVNDLGLQIAVAYWGMKHIKGAKLTGKFDQALGRLYVKAEEKHDEAKVREYLKLMEQGDNKVAKEVRQMAKRAVIAQHKTFKRLNVKHDLLVWESDIAHSGLFAKALAQIMKSPKIQRLTKGEKAGCIIVDLSAYEEFRQLKDTDKVLVRSDDVATYTGKDIAFHFWKFGIIPDPFLYTNFAKRDDNGIVWTTANEGEPGLYKPADAIFNVIGMAQSQPQRTVYTVLESLGHKDASDNYFHLAYEFVNLPGARFSGRKGTWIGFSADDVIREATRRARKEVKSRNPDADATFYRQVSQTVGSAAVRYALLKVAVEKQIIFKWDEVLNFDGNAAPYLLYTHARASSILRKEAAPENAQISVLESPYETELFKLLARFPAIILEIVEGMKREKWGTRIEQFRLAEYTYTLCVAFNSFYNHCPVLKAGTAEIKSARLILVSLYRQVLSNALQLHGITPLDRI